MKTGEQEHGNLNKEKVESHLNAKLFYLLTLKSEV